MKEHQGVVLAVVSSSLGGTAAAVTRYLVDDADAVTLAILRWGIGFACILPVVVLAIVSLLRGERGIEDRIARTFLVPR